MVSIEEARKLIHQHCKPLQAIDVLVRNSYSHVLSEDIHSPVNLPSFDQSAMDGFALKRSDLDEGLREFEIIGEVQAGPYNKIEVLKGQAVRIFTGAVVPSSTDVIIIQEVTEIKGQILLINEYEKGQKSNIRSEGEQVRKGELALPKGHYCTPAGVGFLASMGLEKVKVFSKPDIALIATGNELKPPGSALAPGEIHESNSATLSAALRENRFYLGEDRRVTDDLEASVGQVAAALENNDVLILSGGISVGKYDYAREAMERNGVKEIFYKVNQKPGKPLYFGKKGEKLVFALPGNPASLLTCFYLYVLPALQLLSGMHPPVPDRKAVLRHEYNYRGRRPEFLKASLDGGGVSILEGQASFVLRSFAQANALVYIHGENRTLAAGEEVEVISISGS